MDYCVVNFGGFNGTSAVNTADAFKVSSEGIEKLNAPTLVSARTDLAASSAGNFIFAMGGNTGSNASNAVDVFKVNDNGVGRVEGHGLSLSVPRYCLAAASAGNYVFAIGGNTGDVASKVVDVFEVNSSSVAKVTDHGLSLGTARGRLAAATAGNRVIAVGGITDNDQASATLDAFKLTDDGGFEGLSVPEYLSVARYDLAAASVGNYVFAMGGNTGSNASNAVDVFQVNDNGVGRVLAHGLSLSVPRYCLAAASVGDYVFAMGGFDGTNALDTVDVFKIENGKFEIVTNHGLSLKQARAYLSAVSAGNCVLAMGGFDGSSYSNAVDVFYNYN